MKALVVALLVACSAPAKPQTPPIANTGTREVAPAFSVAIVMSGWELWQGNDKVARLPEDDPSRTPGMLPYVRAGLEASKAPERRGSQAMLITYTDRAAIKLPMGPIERLTPDVVGTQDDYFGTVGIELVAGVRLAAAELMKVQGKRYLIVIGDGADTNPEQARDQLGMLQRDLAAAGIEVRAIVYKTPLSVDVDAVKWLTPNVARVSTGEDFKTALAYELDRLGT